MAKNRSAARGQYYKQRTKVWLEKHGYAVAQMERVQTIHFRRDSELQSVPVKRDQFGSDLLAMNRKELIFVQVKGGEFITQGMRFPDARRKFAEYPFPSYVKRWVIAWVYRAREPYIVCPEKLSRKWQADVQRRRKPTLFGGVR